MDTIYKYPIEITDEQTIYVPAAFCPLHAGLDPEGKPCIWCAVDSNRSKRAVKVAVVGTGGRLPDGTHVGSFVQGPFVWHVFLNFATETEGRG